MKRRIPVKCVYETDLSVLGSVVAVHKTKNNAPDCAYFPLVCWVSGFAGMMVRMTGATTLWWRRMLTQGSSGGKNSRGVGEVLGEGRGKGGGRKLCLSNVSHALLCRTGQIPGRQVVAADPITKARASRQRK